MVKRNTAVVVSAAIIGFGSLGLLLASKRTSTPGGGTSGMGSIALVVNRLARTRYNLSNTTKTVGQTATLSCTAIDTAGQPLAGVGIGIYDTGGFEYVTGTTNSSGAFSTSFTYGCGDIGQTRSYYAKANFGGVFLTSNIVSVVVSATNSVGTAVFQAGPSSGTAPLGVQFAVGALDASCQGYIAGLTATIWVNGMAIGTVQTQTGFATFNYSFTAPGTYTAYAVVGGIQSSVVTIIVSAPAPTQPSITITPASGGSGQIFQMNGVNMPPNATIAYLFYYPNGYAGGGGSVTTNSSGQFSTTFRYVNQGAGVYYVLWTQPTGYVIMNTPFTEY